MKILIVEDDPSINQLLFDLLTPKYTVTQSYSGTEGCMHLERNSFDCILLDLMLPGLSGKELIKKMRSLTACPIIIVSAITDVTSRVDLLDLGADDYITKPFDNREVLARIAVQLRKPYVKSQSFSLGNARYDENQHCIMIENSVLNLTLKELELLILLMRSPNRVFTKASLYENTWHDPYLGDDNTLAVHVSRLRKALNEHNANFTIETIWGVGYKLKI